MKKLIGGVALPSPVYAIYGTRGSLVSEDEQDIKLKYLDPKMKMPTTKAHPETPPRSGGFGGSIAPKWIRKTIMTEPANGLNLTDIYHVLYEAIWESNPPSGSAMDPEGDLFYPVLTVGKKRL